MTTVFIILLVIVAANLLILAIFRGGDMRPVNDRVRYLEDEDQLQAIKMEKK